MNNRTLAHIFSEVSAEDFAIMIKNNLDQAGLVIVPKEPTKAMHLAARSANVGPRSTVHNYIYKAMIEAVDYDSAKGDE
jgi:hypothetical protein